MQVKSWSVPLRGWQEKAFGKLLEDVYRQFLLVATPGAGKTLWALRVLHALLEREIIRRIVVVVPTDNLRTQWAREAAEVGIQLDPDFRNAHGFEARDYLGIVTTYASVAMQSDLHRANCGRIPTGVVFDEIHHAGDELPHGRALLNAFDPAISKLSLSGTPFRGEGGAIPFVTYNNGRSVADFTYGYGQALSDDVCRLVLFPHYEGTMHWSSNGQAKSASFSEKLSDKDSSHRWRTALMPEGEWLASVIAEADKKLLECREEGHANAAGLIVAKDQNHAREVGRLVRSITQCEPMVAVSEDPEAGAKIREFKSSLTRWGVAVRMLSEGADIPRLRVGVFAANVFTELFFRQFVGRFVRFITGLLEQTAYLYIANDERLVGYAQTIKEERDHVLIRQEPKTSGGDGGERLPSDFQALGAGQADFRGVINELHIGLPAEIEAGTRFLREAGLILRLNDDEKARLGRAVEQLRKSSPAPEPIHEPTQVQSAVFEEKRRLLPRRNKLARVFGHVICELCPDLEQKLVHKCVNRKLAEHSGSYTKDATVEQLRNQIATCEGWLKDLRQAQREGREQSWLEQWEVQAAAS